MIDLYIASSGLITIQTRLANGDLFKRKYIGYARKDAVAEFKAELLEL